MHINVQGLKVASPFKVLREISGISLDAMANTTYLNRDLLESLEGDEWHTVPCGEPMVKDALARVGCVVAAKVSCPGLPSEALPDSWLEPFNALLNSYNFSSTTATTAQQ